MDGASVSLRPADEGDLSYVESLLARHDLPSRDVRSKPACFYIASAARQPVGIGGLERAASHALLRSIVVESGAQGRGYGTEICKALERLARREGIESLYLLTETATAFFDRLGYVECARDAAPAPIRETAQFAELCPTSATCLRKSLGTVESRHDIW